jgi:uncharacterized protein YjbI with pentapeptide repeats
MTDSDATPALKQAAQNPWYLLATLYGEPDGSDEQLKAKNRVAWNRYYASRWTDKQREMLKGLVYAAELVPFSNTELSEIRERFRSRAEGIQVEMPGAHQRVDFTECRFDQGVYFERYVFGSADFRSATFSGDTYFSSATFSGDAYFSRATFSGYASFRSATFSGYAYFSRVTFSGYAYFSSATFGQAAIFTNSEFKAPTDFEDSRFLGEPPRFHQGKLHEDTVWHGVEWPAAPTGRRKARRFTGAYERLKLEMDRLKKHEDELMFFAEEMKCRRVAAGWFKGLPIAAYGWLCDYGRSYVMPLGWMVAVFGAGVPALWLLQPDLGWGKAVGLSAVNCLAGLGIRKDLMGKVLDHLGPGALIVSGAQTVAGLILLFLIGLGLRNRFRMK